MTLDTFPRRNMSPNANLQPASSKWSILFNFVPTKSVHVSTSSNLLALFDYLLQLFYHRKLLIFFGEIDRLNKWCANECHNLSSNLSSKHFLQFKYKLAFCGSRLEICSANVPFFGSLTSLSSWRILGAWEPVQPGLREQVREREWESIRSIVSTLIYGLPGFRRGLVQWPGDKCKYGRVACHSHMSTLWHSLANITGWAPHSEARAWCTRALVIQSTLCGPILRAAANE